jgi:hypothetical protein
VVGNNNLWLLTFKGLSSGDLEPFVLVLFFATMIRPSVVQSFYVLCAFITVSSAYLVDPPAGAPVDPHTVQDCSNWIVAQSSDTCQSVASTNSLTITQLTTYVCLKFLGFVAIINSSYRTLLSHRHLAVLPLVMHTALRKTSGLRPRHQHHQFLPPRQLPQQAQRRMESRLQCHIKVT